MHNDQKTKTWVRSWEENRKDTLPTIILVQENKKLKREKKPKNGINVSFADRPPFEPASPSSLDPHHGTV